MKKCFVIGLIMAMVPNMGVFAAQKTVDMLIAEKQAKMKKLEKCKGTTKGLKIAGLSTLGLTAVGVAGNIAEAVVLDDYKGKVKKEKEEYTKQSNLKTKLEAEAKAKAEQAAQQEAQRQKFAAICGGLSGTVQNINSKDWCVRTVTESVVSDKIADTIKSVDESCKNVQYNSSNDDGNLYTANCKDIDMIFNFTNVTCSSDTQEFKDGKCADKEKSEESKEGSKEEGKGEEDKNKPGDKDGKNGKGGKDAQPKPKTCTPACTGNKVCKNGTCVAKPVPKICTPACSANQTCENGKCVDKQCNPACGENQKCENGECINKENTDDEQAKLNKEAKERMDAFVKACGNARFSPKQIENDSVICDIGGDENKPAKKDIVDSSLLEAAGKLSDVECKQQISYDSSRNFSFVFCSTGLRSGNMNTIRYYHKGYIKDRQTINFFADIEVTLAQAKNLIQYYAQKNNLGTLNCSDDYHNFYNQDWIHCSNSTNEYTFEFDDVKEGSQDTRIGSVSKAVCKILNGSWSAGASYDSDICYLDKNICLGEYTTKVKSILGSDYPTGMELSWLETGRQCKFYNKLQ